MKAFLRSLLAAAVAAPLLMVQVAGSQAADDVVDTVVKAGSFNTLVAAVKAAGLVETLKGKGPFTVLAPNDAAFAKLPKGTLEMLLKPENKKTLASVLNTHVLPGAYSADRLKKAKANVYTVTTAAGTPVTVRKAANGSISVDNAPIGKTDIPASNGTIHVIDAVIVPAAAKKALALAAAAPAAAAKGALPAAKDAAKGAVPAAKDAVKGAGAAAKDAAKGTGAAAKDAVKGAVPAGKDVPAARK